jgi:hypothetical protein
MRNPRLEKLTCDEIHERKMKALDDDIAELRRQIETGKPANREGLDEYFALDAEENRKCCPGSLAHIRMMYGAKA